MNTFVTILLGCIIVPLTWLVAFYSGSLPFYLIMTHWDMPFIIHVLSWIVSGAITVLFIIPTFVSIGWLYNLMIDRWFTFKLQN